jgi:hypothetical protein
VLTVSPRTGRRGFRPSDSPAPRHTRPRCHRYLQFRHPRRLPPPGSMYSQCPCGVISAAASACLAARATRRGGRSRCAPSATAFSTRSSKPGGQAQRHQQDRSCRAQLDGSGASRARRSGRAHYPGSYAPVMIERNGRRVAPMRHQCRMPGWNAAVERQYRLARQRGGVSPDLRSFPAGDAEITPATVAAHILPGMTLHAPRLVAGLSFWAFRDF